MMASETAMHSVVPSFDHFGCAQFVVKLAPQMSLTNLFVCLNPSEYLVNISSWAAPTGKPAAELREGPW